MTTSQTFKLLSLLLVSYVTYSHSMEHPSITIQPFVLERDLQAVKSIIEKDSKFLMYPDKPVEFTLNYLKASNYKTDVLRVNNETVGFVNYAVFDVKLLWFIYWDRSSLLHLLGVNENNRKLGYAQKLAEHAFEACKNDNASHIILNVDAENFVAKKLYEKLGFQQIFMGLHRKNLI